MTTWWDRTFGRKEREPEEEPIPEEPAEQEPEGASVREEVAKLEAETQDAAAETEDAAAEMPDAAADAAASVGVKVERHRTEVAKDAPAGSSGTGMAAIGAVVAQAGTEDAAPSAVPRGVTTVAVKSAPEPVIGEGVEASSAVTDQLRRRIDRVAESFLENESLTDGLDDEAANALIDWGLACSKEIVMSTAGMDDVEAEEATYSQLRATRRLMRSVKRWVPKRAALDAAQNEISLERIFRQAEIVYGGQFCAPERDQQVAFVQQSRAVSSEQAIKDLRALLEWSGG
jgi:hypothetical protein